MRNIAIKLFMLSSFIAITACSSSHESKYPSVANKDSHNVTNTSSNSNFYANMAKNETFVGQKVKSFHQELKKIQTSSSSHDQELKRIKDSILQNTTQYNDSISQIETKLQIGTTPGNPNMYLALQQAQSKVQSMSVMANTLDTLSAKIANNKASAKYLLDSINSAFGISGAVDADHVNLRNLQGQTEQVLVGISNLGKEVNKNIAYQQQYLSNSRAQINRLNSAIQVGNMQEASATTSPVVASNIAPANEPAALFTGKRTSNVTMRGKPVFSINASNEDIDYADGLKIAIDSALERKPSTIFEVVAISNSSSSRKAQNFANKIFQEIVTMGVNANNVNIGAQNSENASAASIAIYAK